MTLDKRRNGSECSQNIHKNSWYNQCTWIVATGVHNDPDKSRQGDAVPGLSCSLTRLSTMKSVESQVRVVLDISALEGIAR